MTKKKLHEEVLSLCETHKAGKELTEALSNLTKPKVGGASDVNDYTVFDSEGNPIYVFCNYHKKWEPVLDEIGNPVFAEDAKSKNGLHRTCIVGDKQYKEAAKIFNASKTAVLTDVLDEKLSGAEGKEAIESLKAARNERQPRADGLGDEDRPDANVLLG